MTTLFPFLLALLLATELSASVLKSPRAVSNELIGSKAMVIPQPPQYIIHWDNQNGIGMLIESTKDLTDSSWEMRQWCGLGVTNVSFPRTNSQEFFRAVAIPTDN